MNRYTAWRKSILSEPTTGNIQGNYGLQGSSSDYRGRVMNLSAPYVKYYRNPWIPQYNILEPFPPNVRVVNPSPGVQKLQPQSGHYPSTGPLVFTPAGTASINFKGF